jgi:hypothetical protein
LMDILLYPWPCRFVEGSIKTIRARCCIASHLFNDGMGLW